MNVTQIRELSNTDISKTLNEKKRGLLNLRIREATTGPIPDTTERRKIRREVARIKTVIRERQIVVAESKKENG